MKDTSSFFCNLDYLLIPVKLHELPNILKKGLKPVKKPYKSFIEAQSLLPKEESGVYAVAIFRQWKNKYMRDFDIDNIDKDTEVVLKIDKSVVLYTPLHFNKQENHGRQDDANTLVSSAQETSNNNIWKYDIVHKLDELLLNEVIFHKEINPDFIKEIWYFTENAPPNDLYNEHYKLKLVNNSKKVLL